MTLALLLAAAPPAAMVREADQAAERYISCLFAQSRQAHGEKLALTGFKRRLAKACISEEHAMVRSMTRVLEAKGEPGAAATARQSAAEARTSVISTYQTILRMEPELKRLEEACRQNPDACR